MLFGSIRAMGRRKPTWMYGWFRPWGYRGEAGFLRRVKLALSPRNHFYALPLFAPLLMLGASWVAMSFITGGAPLDFISGMMIGYAGATALAYPIDLSKSLAKYRQQIAIYAAQKLARRANPAITNEILVPLTQSPIPSLRIAAAMGLRELGTKDGGEALQLLTTDADASVANAANHAFGDLQAVYQGKGLLSVRTMETYVQEHAYLVRRLRGKRAHKDSRKDLEKLDEITRQIDEIVFSQLPLRRSFPDVYCQNCYTRGEHQRYEEWDWVRCRQCREVHALRPGVRQVVGQIGGDAHWQLTDGVLHMSLWDDAQRKGRSADLDILEVVAGKPINYDWAVSVVVGKLHNQSPGVGSRIAVRLVGAPVLEANTLQLLKTLDGGLVIG
jgi:hypothetical protein